MGVGWLHAGSWSGSGLSPGPGPHCVVFLGRSLQSHSASLHPGITYINGYRQTWMLGVTVWNVKKQFVAQSVIHVRIEKLTTAMENELV